MTVKRWNIYRANLDPVVGSEQCKSRPVIIISEDEINNLLNIVNIIHIEKERKQLKENERFNVAFSSKHTNLKFIPLPLVCNLKTLFIFAS